MSYYLDNTLYNDRHLFLDGVLHGAAASTPITTPLAATLDAVQAAFLPLHEHDVETAANWSYPFYAELSGADAAKWAFGSATPTEAEIEAHATAVVSGNIYGVWDVRKDGWKNLGGTMLGVTAGCAALGSIPASLKGKPTYHRWSNALAGETLTVQATDRVRAVDGGGGSLFTGSLVGWVCCGRKDQASSRSVYGLTGGAPDVDGNPWGPYLVTASDDTTGDITLDMAGDSLVVGTPAVMQLLLVPPGTLYAMTTAAADDYWVDGDTVGDENDQCIRFTDGGAAYTGYLEIETWPGSSHNKMMVRASAASVAASEAFSSDGVTPNDAAKDTWLKAFWSAYRSLRDDTIEFEFGSSYWWECGRGWANALIGLPSGHAALTDIRHVVDLMYERMAALTVGGILDVCSQRDKQWQATGPFAPFKGFWLPLEGQTLAGLDATDPAVTRNNEHAMTVAAALGKWSLPAAAETNLLHEGVTTFDAALHRDCADPTEEPNRAHYQGFRYQSFPSSGTPVAYAVTSIQDPAAGWVQADPDYPRRAKVAGFSGETYFRAWLTCPDFGGSASHDRDSDTNGQFNAMADWTGQHRNVVMLVNTSLSPTEIASPFPAVADADDEDTAHANWAFARVGDLYFAWWFSTAYSVDGSITYNSGMWPNGGETVRRIRATGAASQGALLGVWHAGQWANWAAFVATLGAITPSYAAGTLTVTLPLTVPTAPDTTENRALVLAEGARLTVGGVAQTLPAVATITRA